MSKQSFLSLLTPLLRVFAPLREIRFSASTTLPDISQRVTLLHQACTDAGLSRVKLHGGLTGFAQRTQIRKGGHTELLGSLDRITPARN